MTDRAGTAPGGVAGLVLAAGAGTRYGQPKAPVLVDGERLVDRAVRNLHEGGCTPVLVVLGAWIGDVPGADVIENPEWREGMGSSLRAGLAALAERPGVDRVVVTLVDLPGLTGRAVRRVVECRTDIVVSTYNGERGHPVAFSRTHWEAIRGSARGDQGARSFLLSRNDISLVEVGDIALGYDLDEPGE